GPDGETGDERRHRVDVGGEIGRECAADAVNGLVIAARAGALAAQRGEGALLARGDADRGDGGDGGGKLRVDDEGRVAAGAREAQAERFSPHGADIEDVFARAVGNRERVSSRRVRDLADDVRGGRDGDDDICAGDDGAAVGGNAAADGVGPDLCVSALKRCRQRREQYSGEEASYESHEIRN